MPITISKDDFLNRVDEKYLCKYNFNNILYKNLNLKIKLTCKLHGDFYKSPKQILRASSNSLCDVCLKKRYNYDYFILDVINKFGQKYPFKFIRESWKGYQFILEGYCLQHEKPVFFKKTPRQIIYTNHFKCEECLKAIPACNKWSTKIFVSKLLELYGNKYDYSLVSYVNSRKKVKLICNNHFEPYIFKVLPNHARNGTGCNKCSGNNFTLDDFLFEAKKVHKNKYDYSLIKNIDSPSNYINIICNESETSHVFKQKAKKHLMGQGCGICYGNKLKNTEWFIKKSRKIHNNRFDYSKTVYINNSTKIKIVCKKHGEFLQYVDNHLKGHGCNQCSNNVSKKEIRWLNNLGIKEENRQISLPNILKKIKIDGYDPETNTVYEFLGSYWHGDPLKFNPKDINKRANKTFGELYNKTIQKEIEIRKAGYNYQFIWESDFKILNNL